MLFSERRMKALSSTLLASLRMPHIENTLANQLKQQHLTQLAMEQLGITDINMPVATLPSVNTILPIADFPRDLPDKTHHIIQIAGSPHAGKTSAGRKVAEPYKHHIYCEESYPYAIRRGIHASNKARATQLFEGYDLEPVRYMGLMRNQEILRAPIFQERGYIDQVPMRRMHFLNGEIGYAKNKLDIHAQIDFFTMDKEFDLTFILCLVPPQISWERGSRVSFLHELHEQYLRLHHEVLNYQLYTGKPLPITYACLDFSGTQEVNNALLKKTIDTILTPAKFRD